MKAIRELVKTLRKQLRGTPTSQAGTEASRTLRLIEKELALPEAASYEEIIDVHKIGTFTIVELRDKKNPDEHFFRVYGFVFDSLDDAILAAICYKYSEMEDFDYVLRILQQEKLDL